MNRQIKFRGKRLDNGAWVYGYPADGYYINDINAPVRTVIEVDSHTVGQFTGLLDCNGKEVYEGDIFLIRVNSGEVKWNDSISAFCVRFSLDKQVGKRPIGVWLSEDPNSVIIGNIHDNPELMN